MTKRASPPTEAETMMAVVAAHASAYYTLRLYVTGATPHSARAIANIRKICERHLDGRYELEVVDIAQNPESASADQVIAAPTLVKMSPLPVRRFIGDMSLTDRILFGLDLQPTAAISATRS